MSNFKERFATFLKSFFFPPKCVLCQSITNGECLCDECLERWEKEKRKSCSHCGKEHIKCQCMLNFNDSHLSGVFHLVEYKDNDLAMALIFGIKDRPDELIDKFLGKELYGILAHRDDFNSENTLVTYVPRRKEMILKYGSDQARAIAVSLTKCHGTEPVSLLTRKGSKEQKHLNKEERMKNVKGSYYLAQGAEEIIKGKTVFIVDDIITTGSTMNYCAELLVKGGAERVYAVSIARRT